MSDGMGIHRGLGRQSSACGSGPGAHGWDTSSTGEPLCWSHLGRKEVPPDFLTASQLRSDGRILL